jgi:hypothetical protein
MTELFELVVYKNFVPLCWVNAKYKMYFAHDFVLAALLAMAED